MKSLENIDIVRQANKHKCNVYDSIYITVIELSGVQFGLKSYARVRFQITSMISDQNCTTRSSFAT